MRSEELKQAAIRVIAERGYHAAKVSEIVAEAGVAQGTFYRYYPSKQAIFGEILGDYLALLAGAVSGWEIPEVGSLDQLRTGLIGIGLHLAQGMLQNRDLTRIFFNEALAVDTEFNQVVSRFYEQVVEVIRLVNEHCFHLGIYREMDFDVLAQCVIGLVERVVIQYVVINQPNDEEALQIVAQVIDLVLFGVANQRIDEYRE